MEPKTARQYKEDPRIEHWLLKVENYPEVRYIRFLDDQDYTMVTDWKEAHVITGVLEFARGFCLAASLCINEQMTVVRRPATQPYERKQRTDLSQTTPNE